MLLVCAALAGYAAAWMAVTGRSLLGAAALLLLAFVFLWEALFEDRLDTGARVTRTERILAGIWLWFRRITLGAVAALWFTIACWVGERATSPEGYAGCTALFLLSFFSLWVALFGAGRHRSASDDLSVHRKRKARYGWRL